MGRCLSVVVFHSHFQSWVHFRDHCCLISVPAAANSSLFPCCIYSPSSLTPGCLYCHVVRQPGELDAWKQSWWQQKKCSLWSVLWLITWQFTITKEGRSHSCSFCFVWIQFTHCPVLLRVVNRWGVLKVAQVIGRKNGGEEEMKLS